MVFEERYDWNGPINNYRKYIRNYCENCGLENIEFCVHHKDRNRKNNLPSNLMTLCYNCHKKIHKDIKESECFRNFHWFSKDNSYWFSFSKNIGKERLEKLIILLNETGIPFEDKKDIINFNYVPPRFTDFLSKLDNIDRNIRLEKYKKYFIIKRKQFIKDLTKEELGLE